MQVPIAGDLKLMVILPFTGDRNVVTFVAGGGNWPRLVDMYRSTQAIELTRAGNVKGNRWIFS